VSSLVFTAHLGHETNDDDDDGGGGGGDDRLIIAVGIYNSSEVTVPYKIFID